MKCAILSIGNEVVEGFVLNSNATYFASKLNELGIKVNKHLTIIDTETEIIAAIDYLNKDHNLIIVSGGLGPTGDDITKESIAKALGLTLKIDEHELQKLKDFFKMRNYNYSSVNDKQALYSELDTILINQNGTANGYYFTKDQVVYCVLPGPPIENRTMFDSFVKTLSTEEVFEKDLYLINIGESNAEATMKHLYQKYPQVYIGCYMQDFGINYRLKSTNKQQIEACFLDLKTIFKDNYLCASKDPLADFVNFLIANNITISFAESCTAGLAASFIASIPGSSHILKESIITYSNEAKQKYLKVPLDLLNNYGAVSQECAQAMAQGLFEKTNSDLCIAITGIAGPDGGSTTKPVGLVHFVLHYKNKNYYFVQNFIGQRNLIRTRAAKSIIFETYRLLQQTI
ncbi:nicotinamide-nucleotide amidohydrolase family protein [Erysipelotrichaceae bacterium OttesenSCG-928-M19]|nr:nicotinamide-nucleotide amidohydrolase family protein [Erysipelotrichaceae bacterium OttesenSCG-928-M19]